MSVKLSAVLVDSFDSVTHPDNLVLQVEHIRLDVGSACRLTGCGVHPSLVQLTELGFEGGEFFGPLDWATAVVTNSCKDGCDFERFHFVCCLFDRANIEPILEPEKL